MLRITAVKTVLYNSRNELVDKLPELIGKDDVNFLRKFTVL